MTAREDPRIRPMVKTMMRTRYARFSGEVTPEQEAANIISDLKAAGYSIVHESEIHGETKQRCIAAVEEIEIIVPLTPGAPDGASIALQLAVETLRALPDGGVE